MKLHFAAVFVLILVFVSFLVVLLFTDRDEPSLELIFQFGEVAIVVLAFVLLDVLFPNWRYRRNYWIEKIVALSIFLAPILVYRILF